MWLVKAQSLLWFSRTGIRRDYYLRTLGNEPDALVLSQKEATRFYERETAAKYAARIVGGNGRVVRLK